MTGHSNQPADGWIPHKPGDPMPVDGETVVTIRRRDESIYDEPCPAKCFRWDEWNLADITAYRIHKPDAQLEYNKQTARHEKIKAEYEKEREMKYKAGDRVTIVLDAYNAQKLNDNKATSLLEIEKETEVIFHELAPEPIVGYVYYDDSGALPFKGLSHTTERKHQIRITYHPATKEVKAEIV